MSFWKHLRHPVEGDICRSNFFIANDTRTTCFYQCNYPESCNTKVQAKMMLQQTIASGNDFQLFQYMNTGDTFDWLGESSSEEEGWCSEEEGWSGLSNTN
jgi:hypothetical protein